ncbi:hypothetical protein SMD_4188 [Stenotrophomonas maltophilia D457]|nr:hypothetical protein SMD_4188 [Stenotrophomonas maltophilia D457]
MHPCIDKGFGVDRATRGQRRSDLRAYVMRDGVVLLSSRCKKALTKSAGSLEFAPLLQRIASPETTREQRRHHRRTS